MSYLDDPRVFFAAERTLLAWQRTSVALIGLGFVVERFGLFERMVNATHPMAQPSTMPTLLFGVVFLVLGALVAALAAWQYQRFVAKLSYPELPRGHGTWMGPLLNYTLAIAGLAMAAWFVWSSA